MTCEGEGTPGASRGGGPLNPTALCLISKFPPGPINQSSPFFLWKNGKHRLTSAQHATASLEGDPEFALPMPFPLCRKI